MRADRSIEGEICCMARVVGVGKNSVKVRLKEAFVVRHAG